MGFTDPSEFAKLNDGAFPKDFVEEVQRKLDENVKFLEAHSEAIQTLQKAREEVPKKSR